MQARYTVILSAIVLSLGAAAAYGHHSFAAEFDVNAPVRINGTVVRIDFANPHTWIYVDVRTKAGELQQWAIEGGPPTTLLRRGWKRGSVPIGAEVIILGYRARDNSFKASGNKVTLADGTVLFMGSATPGSTER